MTCVTPFSHGVSYQAVTGALVHQVVVSAKREAGAMESTIAKQNLVKKGFIVDYGEGDKSAG